MSIDILHEIRQILHGLGEERPRRDAVLEIYSVLRRQMALLIFRTSQAAKKNEKILYKHVLSVLQHHKTTVIRILSYNLLKEKMLKYAKISAINSEFEFTLEKTEKNPKKKLKLNSDETIVNKNHDITAFNLDDSDTLYFDPVKTLISIDFKSESVKLIERKNKSTFNEILKAIVDLKMNIKITNEDIKKSNELRQNRVNDLSLVISSRCYEGFQSCRKKNFLNKTGDFLLDEVHKALPPHIDYDKEIRDLFLFLAKETIACLFDRICENRKKDVKNTESIDYFDNLVDICNGRIADVQEEQSSILVGEICKITKTTWDLSLGDIEVPYKENNDFFKNKLIFD